MTAARNTTSVAAHPSADNKKARPLPPRIGWERPGYLLLLTYVEDDEAYKTYEQQFHLTGPCLGSLRTYRGPYSRYVYHLAF